jgi:5'-phosphate synthase pdxT subunit
LVSPEPTVGVLALQGDFALHRRSLARCGAEVRLVRTARELEGLHALVLPGGESTTMLKLMERTEIEPAIRGFHASGRAIFGTCAGLILLARRVTGPAQRSLGLLDVEVERNGFGRQTDSFETDLALEDGGEVRGVFIRAPRIHSAGPEVRVLARLGDEPVLVREGNVLGASFHPELTDDLRLHRFFLDRVAGEPSDPPRAAQAGG